MLWALLRVRYLLLWSQARSGAGRMALFVTTYLVGSVIFLILASGGYAALVGAARRGAVGPVALALMTSLFLNGILVSLVAGAGPRAAFSDEVLRRYPLTRWERFAARHLSSLLDPFWLFYLALVLGLAGGFAAHGATSFVWAASTGLAFVVASYLAALSTVLLLERMLRGNAALTMLTGVALGAFTVWTAHARRVGLRVEIPNAVVALALDSTPPGALAALWSATDVRAAAWPLAVIVTWCVALAWSVVRLEERTSLPASSSAGIPAAVPDRLGTLFPKVHGPLIAKGLRYALRCNKTRLSLALCVPLLAFLCVQMANGREAEIVALAGFFGVALLATPTLTLNHFGYDGEGVLRYRLFPVQMSDVLHASSLVTVLLGSGACALAGAVFFPLLRLPIDLRFAMMALATAAAGIFWINALGLWTSALWPWRADCRSLRRENQFGAWNQVLGVSIVGDFLLFSFLRENFSSEALRSHWWLFVAAAIVCGLGYLVSWHLVAPVANQRLAIAEVITS